MRRLLDAGDGYVINGLDRGWTEDAHLDILIFGY